MKQGARLLKCSLWLMKGMQMSSEHKYREVAGCPMQSLAPPCDELDGHGRKQMEDAKHKTVHGLHQCSPRVRLPAGQSLQNTLILAHMEMDGHRGKRKKGSRHGVMAEAGKRGMAR